MKNLNKFYSFNDELDYFVTPFDVDNDYQCIDIDYDTEDSFWLDDY